MKDISWRIKLTHRNDGVTISTVKVPFLNWYGDYETAIRIDNEPWRIYKGYSTQKDAINGHEELEKMSREEILKLSFIG